MADQSSDIIKQLQVNLGKILRNYLEPNVSSQHIKLTFSWAQTLVKHCQSHPNLLFSQPQLYKTQLSNTNNLVFNACVYTCLVAARNKVDKLVVTQLVCTTLSLLAIEQQNIDNQREPYKTAPNKEMHSKLAALKLLLRKYQQPIWDMGCKLYPLTQGKKSAKLHQFNHLQSLIYIGYRLGWLCTYRQTTEHIKFSRAVKQLCLQSPSHWYQVYTPLLEYPRLVPIGSFIKLIDESVHLIVMVTEDGYVIAPIKESSDKNTSKAVTKFRHISANKIKQDYASQPLKNLRKLDNWWNQQLDNFVAGIPQLKSVSAYPTLLPLQTAPSSLLIVQDQLNNINTEISIIVKAIEQDRTYVEKIQHAASAYNRTKQNVTTLQHGLTMLGFERANHVLLQFALLSRLNQEYFPQQKSLIIFSELFAAITAELAIQTQIIAEEQAKTVAYFALSRLFTLPTLRTQVDWPFENQDHFKIENLFTVKGCQSLQDGAVILAKAWQQERSIVSVLTHYADSKALVNAHSGMVTKVGFLLGLSLIKAKQVHFPKYKPCPTSDTYTQVALRQLTIVETELNQSIQHAVVKFNYYSPYK
jgi:hypothetical protein